MARFKSIVTDAGAAALTALIAAGKPLILTRAEMCIRDSGKARVLTDINSLVTIGQNMSSDWTSNRVVRVMDLSLIHI